MQALKHVSIALTAASHLQKKIPAHELILVCNNDETAATYPFVNIYLSENVKLGYL